MDIFHEKIKIFLNKFKNCNRKAILTVYLKELPSQLLLAHFTQKLETSGMITHMSMDVHGTFEILS
jgi:hypothetical protein